jgi:hypothetical protein
LSVCKIYETEGRHNLYSIDGVFNELVKSSHIPSEPSETTSFIEKYDGNIDSKCLICAVEGVIRQFREKYNDQIRRFKRYRDKSVAHSERGAGRHSLPCYDDMQALYDFSYDFYRVVNRDFIEVGEALATPYAETSIRNLLITLGVDEPKSFFDD